MHLEFFINLSSSVLFFNDLAVHKDYKKSHYPIGLPETQYHIIFMHS